MASDLLDDEDPPPAEKEKKKPGPKPGAKAKATYTRRAVPTDPGELGPIGRLYYERMRGGNPLTVALGGIAYTDQELLVYAAMWEGAIEYWIPAGAAADLALAGIPLARSEWTRVKVGRIVERGGRIEPDGQGGVRLIPPPPASVTPIRPER